MVPAGQPNSRSTALGKGVTWSVAVAVAVADVGALGASAVTSRSSAARASDGQAPPSSKSQARRPGARDELFRQSKCTALPPPRRLGRATIPDTLEGAER